MMPLNIDNAPGIRWRRRTDGWVAYWIARADIVRRGYRPPTQRLWAGVEPSPDEAATIAAECRLLQEEMLAFGRGGADIGIVSFDGSLRGLAECYQRDPDSPFHALRFKSKRTYLAHLDPMVATLGDRTLSALTARDFRRWFAKWAEPKNEQGARRLATAHARITMIRILISFGVSLLEDEQCKRLSTVLAEMQFEKPTGRTDQLVAEQAAAIIAQAHAAGVHSVALAQAFMFELALRQKDVIGEWLPVDEPGLSEITAHGLKWLVGITWREISPELMLTHRLSKSLRGRHAVNDRLAGKVKRFDLTLSPMIMAELGRIPLEQRTGPLIVDERDGLPWNDDKFRDRWRVIATAAGVPKHVQNRDSRAGAATEAEEATGDRFLVQKALGHSNIETTSGYIRDADRATAKVSIMRAEKRKNRGNDE